MRRTQTILAGLLVLQVALILLVRSPFSQASHGDTRKLFGDLGDFTATRLEITKGKDQAVTLHKADGRWVVDQLGGFPADSSKVDQLVDNLRDLTVRRPVVSSAKYHDTFKVADDDNEGRVKVYAEGSDKPELDLLLGTSPSYRALNVRVAGQDPVYSVSGLSSYDASADTASWIDKQLVDVKKDEVVAMTVTNAEGSFELELAGGNWTLRQPAALAGKPLDAAKVDSLLSAATSLRLAEAAGPVDEAAQGLASPPLTVTLRYKPAAAEAPAEGAEGGAPATGGEVRELVLRVGDKVGDKAQRYVTRSGFGFAGTVWDSSVTKLLEEKPAELLAKSGAAALTGSSEG